MDNQSLFFLIFGASNKNPMLDFLMISGAKFVIYLLFLLTLVLSLEGGIKEKKAIILIILSVPIAFLIIKVIHIFFYEPRPFITYNFSPLINPHGDASFPSVHTTIAFVISLPYLFFKSKWKFLMIPLAIWIGISRVYVGVHYPLDILGGIATAILSLIIAKQIVKFLKIKFSLN